MFLFQTYEHGETTLPKNCWWCRQSHCHGWESWGRMCSRYHSRSHLKTHFSAIKMHMLLSADSVCWGKINFMVYLSKLSDPWVVFHTLSWHIYIIYLYIIMVYDPPITLTSLACPQKLGCVLWHEMWKAAGELLPCYFLLLKHKTAVMDYCSLMTHHLYTL